MAHIEDLGRRIELVSMDSRFHDISIGLYRRVTEGQDFEVLVHSYSQLDGAGDRIAAVVRTMAVLGGMEPVPGIENALRFACGKEHLLACKRIFLEACKFDPDAPLVAPEMTVYDKKSGLDIQITGDGAGAYRAFSEGEAENRERRVAVLAGGLKRLAEMEMAEDSPDRVAFSCGHAHDALVGLLLGRSLNVRAAIREQEAAALRGQLAAPGSREAGSASF